MRSQFQGFLLTKLGVCYLRVQLLVVDAGFVM